LLWIKGDGLLRHRDLGPPLEASKGGRPVAIERWNEAGAPANAAGACCLGRLAAVSCERREILTRNRFKVVTRVLLASAVALAGLSLGGCSGNKGDGVIPSAPEAKNAADAIAKSYADNMIKKYASQSTKKRP
jgi:hypothetical protein